MIDSRHQSTKPSPWAAAEKTPALAHAAQNQTATPQAAAPQGEGAAPKLATPKDVLNVFGRSFGEDAVTFTTADGQRHVSNGPPQADAKPAPPATTSADLQTEFKNNPGALRTLTKITSDKAFQSLSAEDRSALLSQYKSAPNGATAEYLLGVSEYKQASAADKTGDPAAAKARTDKLANSKTPDSGSLTLSGTPYTIKNGQLLDKKGQPAGTIDNLGSYQLTGQKDPSNYYTDIHATVVLKEGEGKDQRTLLSLHDADPNGQLTGTSMNNTFTSKADATLAEMRREGVDMGAAPQGSFRSFQEQDALYAKGRTKPGGVVTQARGGESFHNYGIAADLAFNNDKGQITWPEQGDYGKLWTRYGEVAKKQGLTWGGDWTHGTDRPHIEYHPGITASQASSLKGSYARGGLEGAWDQMGIGEQPAKTH